MIYWVDANWVEKAKNILSKQDAQHTVYALATKNVYLHRVREKVQKELHKFCITVDISLLGTDSQGSAGRHWRSDGSKLEDIYNYNLQLLLERKLHTND